MRRDKLGGLLNSSIVNTQREKLDGCTNKNVSPCLCCIKKNRIEIDSQILCLIITYKSRNSWLLIWAQKRRKMALKKCDLNNVQELQVYEFASWNKIKIASFISREKSMPQKKSPQKIWSSRSPCRLGSRFRYLNFETLHGNYIVLIIATYK